jgi:2-haloacid dehalogenase
MPPVTTVVFDIGNVLIEWDPLHLYRRLIPEEADRARFLAEVCTPAWNLEQDRGRTWAEAVAERAALFPEHADLIAAYDTGWQEMVPGAIAGSVAILEELEAADVPLYAISNFSAEKFVESVARFPFLGRFRGAIVSAHERLVKPDPAIFALCAERYGLDPATCVFIDDVPANIAAARAAGYRTIPFTDPPALRRDLVALGLPLAAAA